MYIIKIPFNKIYAYQKNTDIINLFKKYYFYTFTHPIMDITKNNSKLNRSIFLKKQSLVNVEF